MFTNNAFSIFWVESIMGRFVGTAKPISSPIYIVEIRTEIHEIHAKLEKIILL